MYFLMLLSFLTFKLTSNAITSTQEKAILYSRTMILGMILAYYMSYDSLYTNILPYGLSLYNGLFNISLLSQSSNIFIFFLAGVITVLSSFYPREEVKKSGKPDLITGKTNEEKDMFNLSNNRVNYNYSAEYKKDKWLNTSLKQFNIIEYALITLFIISGAVFLMSTNDLVSLFLSIELQSYGLYILATLYRDSESSTTSALTYFLLGGLSSCFILLGSATLYVKTGTTNLDNVFIINHISEISASIYNLSEIANVDKLLFNSNYEINYINLSLIVLTVGLLFKISAAPFHFWSPDVYDGIPTIVTTFVAIIAKISLFVLLLELVSSTNLESYSNYNNTESINMSYLNYEWKNILIYSSLLSLIIGSILGLTQYRIKRLFAYSTISHVGFILLALSVNKIESIQGYIFYILQYSISNLNVFFILVIIGYSLFNYIAGKQSYKLLDIENSPIQLTNQIKGYFYVNSFLAISFTITIFSLLGIPPLIGFFAKQMVLSAALDNGFIFMTLVGIITSVIGAAYYLNIVKLIFFSKSDYTINNEKDTNTITGQLSTKIELNTYLTVIVSILTMLITLFIFVPGEWFRMVSLLSLYISSF